jgi:hypothetical protein
MFDCVSLNGDRKRFMLTVLQNPSESYAECCKSRSRQPHT